MSSPDDNELLAACLGGEIEKVRSLLEKGVSANARSDDFYKMGAHRQVTPLMCAASTGHLEIVRLLLQSGADVAAESLLYKSDGGAGTQALHFACAGGHLAVMQALLDAGANPNAHGRWGRTPLTLAIREKQFDAVRLLLTRGADVKLRPTRKDYDPPLLELTSLMTNTTSLVWNGTAMVPEASALWSQMPTILGLYELLLKAGADPNAAGSMGQTPLPLLERNIPDEVRKPLAELLRKHAATSEARTLTPGPPSGRASRPASRKPKAVKGGAGDFLDFIADGEPEWSLLAVKAPIDDVSDAFATFAKIAQPDRQVPLEPADDEEGVVAPRIAVVQVRDNPWVVIFRTLFHVDKAAINQVREAAAALSELLKTQALAFAGADPSEEIAFDLFERGKPGEHTDDIDRARQVLLESGVYLPACYPQSKGNRSWLAVAKKSAKKVGRADLFAAPSC